MMLNAYKYTILERNRAYDGFLKMDKLQLRHSLYGGGESQVMTRELLVRNPAVAVLAYDPKVRAVVLIEQFRVGAANEEKPWLVELIAGVVETGETPADVAVREAREEAGADIQIVERIAECYNSAGGSNERTTVFFATVDSRSVLDRGSLATEHEDIRVMVVPVEEFERGLRATATLVLAGWWFLARGLA
jgi:ADP-ribose pyrophosphatase